MALSPLTSLERATAARLLTWASGPEAPDSVIVVRVAPQLSSVASCGERLSTLFRARDVRGLLLVPPADGLCDSRSVVGPALTWSPAAATVRGRRELLGIADSLAPGDALTALASASPGALFKPFDLRSIPTVDLSDLDAGRVPDSVVSRRVVVVDVGGEVSDGALVAAAAMAGVLEDRQRVFLPSWLSVSLGALLALLVALVHRRRYVLTLPLGGLLLSLLWLSSSAFIHTTSVGLFPLVHLSIALGLSIGIVWVPRLLATRKALRHAEDLVERAALMRSEGIHMLDDEEFWPRLGDLASQAHPADAVLVAELPPRQWHLRFWPYRGQGENMISERRRDMRRTPYSNEEGVPEVCVTHRYLVMEGVPTVVVPLIALGEVEGYIFLIGDRALSAHLEAPDVATKMSQDLGLLIRRRRGGEASQRGFRGSTKQGYWESSAAMSRLVEGAEVAVGDLKVFGSLIRNAPVGLLYADPFGHVRVVSRDVVQWLSALGVAVPAQAKDAPLSPGALRLGTVLDALSKQRKADISLANIGHGGGRESYRVPMAAHKDRPATVYRFSLRALQEESDGVTWTAGYVGALVEEEARATDEGKLIPLHPTAATDVLAVRSLADVAKVAVRSAVAQSGKPVRFEPARDQGHAIAYHDEFQDSLVDLLCEAAPRDPSGKGPTVAVADADSTVELTIFDLQFGLPMSALKRVLLAPSDPPLGLEVFGRFVRACIESHGSVHLQEDEWGLSVVARLLRARPLTRLPSMRPPAMRSADRPVG